MNAKRYLSRVASLGCVVCRLVGRHNSPAEIHHIREGQGMAQRASDFLVIPICPEHHRGGTGIHGMGVKAFERAWRLTELDLLAETIRLLEDSQP
ncbi:MAG: Ref family protein [Zoogloeaceae bacterium]|jgi:hypothetical protein|nr:Ref family protein [Zoogloeaceae bacterium]